MGFRIGSLLLILVRVGNWGYRRSLNIYQYYSLGFIIIDIFRVPAPIISLRLLQ